MNQFLTLGLSEKISSLHTMDYLKERAAGVERRDFEAIRSRVPDVEPQEQDRLQDSSRSSCPCGAYPMFKRKMVRTFLWMQAAMW
ncbi:hypothetical protein [Desulfonatronospira sp.]|uniref:hypothetical protein n=1 Tax=Desulfonatronospira sp. TaxID=1962951 RepID=UPI0025C2B371|nr:hypothetical protein [Desulfonatronospira sp.]